MTHKNRDQLGPVLKCPYFVFFVWLVVTGVIMTDTCTAAFGSSVMTN